MRVHDSKVSRSDRLKQTNASIVIIIYTKFRGKKCLAPLSPSEIYEFVQYLQYRKRSSFKINDRKSSDQLEKTLQTKLNGTNDNAIKSSSNANWWMRRANF